MTATGPLIPEAPVHIVNSCAVDIISLLHSRIPADLQLREHGLQLVKPDPSYVLLHPDGSSLAIWRYNARRAAEIERYWRADARAFLEFADLPPRRDARGPRCVAACAQRVRDPHRHGPEAIRAHCAQRSGSVQARPHLTAGAR